MRPIPEEIVPNFEPKKAQNVNFEWFVGPHDPFCLFSHYILCPTEPMEKFKKITIPSL